MLAPLSLMIPPRLNVPNFASKNFGGRTIGGRQIGLRAGHIVEIGFLIVAFKGNRDNNGLFRLVMNSLVFWMDARVAEKMAAMSMQMGRIKPADSTKRRQFCSSYSIIIGEVKAVSGSRFWLDSGLDSGADSGVDFV
ncbi:hypothetical protein C8J57DRAFT_1233787 [Mycena rebaudengoi]|nr:hypothetical protein C8J57DRAFT_1233787 [Mycena rebaudengoi]